MFAFKVFHEQPSHPEVVAKKPILVAQDQADL